MNEPYVVDGHASMVEVITDFELLKKLVQHDLKGSLFARKVYVECTLADKPYAEVLSLLSKINASSIDYSFSRAELVIVKSVEDWEKLKQSICVNTGLEKHVLSEMGVDSPVFNEMQVFLKGSGSLLVDMSQISKISDVKLHSNLMIH